MRIINHRTGIRATVAAMVVLTIPAAVSLAAAPGGARAQASQDRITVIVPVGDVSAGGASLAPKGQMGDLFEESYRPSSSGAVERQDAIGVGAAGGRGVFLGTVNLKGGQIIYAGSTDDQDDTTYAVLGGTGRYVGSHGLLTTSTINRAHVRITIQLS